MARSKVVGLEEVMDHTDDRVSPLLSLYSFVNEVVDLHRGNVPVGGTSLYSCLTKIGQYR